MPNIKKTTYILYVAYVEIGFNTNAIYIRIWSSIFGTKVQIKKRPNTTSLIIFNSFVRNANTDMLVKWQLSIVRIIPAIIYEIHHMTWMWQRKLIKERTIWWKLKLANRASQTIPLYELHIPVVETTSREIDIQHTKPALGSENNDIKPVILVQELTTPLNSSTE